MGKRAITRPRHPQAVVLGHLRSLQRDRAIIRSFFHEPHTKYAAA